MMTFWQDVRYGVRVLLKNPGFAAIAILTLALGIGANSALFSVVPGVLLKPLPFPNPAQLYPLYFRTAAFGEGSISYPNFIDWQTQNHSFSDLGGSRSEDINLTGAGEPERWHGHMISAEFFSSTLGAWNLARVCFLRLGTVVGRKLKMKRARFTILVLLALSLVSLAK